MSASALGSYAIVTGLAACPHHFGVERLSQVYTPQLPADGTSLVRYVLNTKESGRLGGYCPFRSSENNESTMTASKIAFLHRLRRGT